MALVLIAFTFHSSSPQSFDCLSVTLSSLFFLLSCHICSNLCTRNRLVPLSHESVCDCSPYWLSGWIPLIVHGITVWEMCYAYFLLFQHNCELCYVWSFGCYDRTVSLVFAKVHISVQSWTPSGSMNLANMLWASEYSSAPMLSVKAMAN